MEQMWELDKDLRCGTVDQSLKEIHKNCEIEAGLCTTILWNDRNSFLDVANMRLGKHIITNLYQFMLVAQTNPAVCGLNKWK